MNPFRKQVKAKAREPQHLQTGRWGEACAESFLKSKGYNILGRRVRVSARDEIDLVVREKKTLVFVEVKTRSSVAFGRPVLAVNRKKIHILSRGAVRYLKKLGFPEVYIRFDVIEVIGKKDDREPEINHIENAFQLDKRYTLP